MYLSNSFEINLMVLWIVIGIVADLRSLFRTVVLDSETVGGRHIG